MNVDDVNLAGNSAEARAVRGEVLDIVDRLPLQWQIAIVFSILRGERARIAQRAASLQRRTRRGHARGREIHPRQAMHLEHTDRVETRLSQDISKLKKAERAYLGALGAIALHLVDAGRVRGERID